MSRQSCFAMLGPPASGKGTQGRLLAERLGIAYLSTGAQLRREIEEGTELGCKAKGFLDANQYIPDTLAIEMVNTWVARQENGWLLDGFPRSVPQAEALLATGAVFTVLHLTVPEDELRDRVTTRRECTSCGATTTNAQQSCPKCGNSSLQARADDSTEGFEKRLQAYQKLTVPVLEFLVPHTKVITITGGGSREEVAQAIAQQIT